jgi:hypothetical protein
VQSLATLVTEKGGEDWQSGMGSAVDVATGRLATVVANIAVT